MRAYLQQLAYEIRGSYWFLPTMMVLMTIALSIVSVQIDRALNPAWMQQSIWFSLNQPEGARAILATVAGSMITVAGVTFSLTILAVSHATSHFGPRLLDNFMRDRGNQITLGTFISTFIYCLLILRVVRSADTNAADGVNLTTFVPQLSLVIALALTLSSVAVLIFFIHHIPESINISNVLRRLAQDMERKIDSLFPESLGSQPEQDEPATTAKDSVVTIHSRTSGYLQGVDATELIGAAKQQEVILRLLKRPGDFVYVDEPIAETTASDRWDDRASDQVRSAIMLGHARTPTQDLFFILNQFVEVAVRALSPGVNEPFTANQCIDWLCSGLVRLSQRQIPSRFRLDDDGSVRLITPHVSYADFTTAILGRLAPYVERDPNVTEYLIAAATRVRETSNNAELNRLILEQIDDLRRASSP